MALAVPTHLRQENTDALLLRRGCALGYERSGENGGPGRVVCQRFLLHAGGGTLLILMARMFPERSELRA